ncbi:hypothetical protein [Streptomyces sp. NBC_01443]|nr:hypothetical protein [Streptomyces sp. NBC_01443]
MYRPRAAAPTTAHPMRGWVTVAGPALAEDSVLRHWVTAAVAFACTLPPK